MGSGVGKKRKIIVVCGEAEGNNQGKNRDKRRIVQTKEIVAYRVLLSVNKFCRKREWKKKKRLPILVICGIGFLVCYHKYCCAWTYTPMSDCFSLGSCSEEFFIQVHVDSKKHIKASRGTGLPIILFTVLCTSLLSL